MISSSLFKSIIKISTTTTNTIIGGSRIFQYTYSTTNKAIQSVKGTYDYFPDRSKLYRHVTETGRSVAGVYGYKELITPIIEPYELFNRSVGENSDIVMKEMFSFKDLGDHSICLRPEGTAGIIRAIVNQKEVRSNTPPKRYFYKGPMFRYERPQRGRARQFEQFGIELIGEDHPQGDVEIIELACHFIQKLNIPSENVKLKINSLGDQETMSKYSKELLKFYEKHLPNLSQDSQKRIQRGNPLRVLDSKDENDRSINKDSPKLAQFLNESSRERFSQVLKGLDNIGIKYELDDDLVRGLDYYRHTIFEIIVDESNGQPPLAILGGGRYDGLANQLGYPEVEGILPSVGWACGIERILLYMDHSKVEKEENPISIVSTDSKYSNTVYQICNRLRKNGFYTVVPSFNQSETFSKQLKKAGKLESQFVLILGEDEMKSDSICLKDLVNRSQSIIKLSDIELELSKRLNK
eukprot:gene4950-6167_t